VRVAELSCTPKSLPSRMTAGFLQKACGSTSTSSLRLPLVFGPAASHLRKYAESRRRAAISPADGTVAALISRERLRRVQHLNPLVDRRHRGELSCKALRGRRSPAEMIQAREPAERRIERALARLDLARIKRLAVTRHQGLHYGMFHLVGLQIADAAALIAPGAPDHLVEQLERALGGARIAIAQAQIGVDDADQIKARKINAPSPPIGCR